MSPKEWPWNKAGAWLTRPMAADVPSPNDFDCVLDGIRPADVPLIEGRTRIGEIIKCPLPRDDGTGFCHALPWQDDDAHEPSRRYLDDPDALRIAKPREPETNAGTSGGATRTRQTGDGAGAT